MERTNGRRLLRTHTSAVRGSFTRRAMPSGIGDSDLSTRRRLMSIRMEVAELIKEIQSLAEGLDEWSLKYYSDEDRDRLTEARNSLREVLQRVGSK